MERNSDARLPRKGQISRACYRKKLLETKECARCDLRGANLKSANLEYADLRAAYLYGADLRGASLEGADLTDANLRGAKIDLTDFLNVMSAKFCNTTIRDPRRREIRVAKRLCFFGSV